MSATPTTLTMVQTVALMVASYGRFTPGPTFGDAAVTPRA
jgi:hypothetical protein